MTGASPIRVNLKDPASGNSASSPT